MAHVFISYRRSDTTSGYASWLYERLAASFGSDHIFMDVDSLPLGVDFVENLDRTLIATDVAIILIGPGWLNATDETGARRLDDPHDFVRIEVAAALHANIQVIPVLVDGARIPASTSLPEDLRPLTRRQALIFQRRGDTAIRDLLAAVAHTAAEPEAAEPALRKQAERARAAPSWRFALAAVVIAVTAGVAIIATHGSGGAKSDYRALLTALPASIRASCKNDPSGWMKASAQVTCSTPNYGLTYGLWPSPTEAQQWIGVAHDSNGVSCAATTRTAMKIVLPRATTGCEDNRKDKGIDMWWNDDGSRVAAQFFWFNRDQAGALNQWQKVATAR